jgi:hypothetical protein
MAQKLVGGILGTVLTGAIEAAVTGAIGAKATKPDAVNADAVAAEVVKRLGQNQLVVNEVSAEKPIQSRVVVGSTIALIGAFFTAAGSLWAMVKSGDVNIELASVQIATMWGAGYALYGRLASGLTPLFSRFFSRG